MVRTEVRWVTADNGETRPMYNDKGALKCAARFEYDRSFGHGPCNKPLKHPPSTDVHAPHRCSKCEELEEDGRL